MTGLSCARFDVVSKSVSLLIVTSDHLGNFLNVFMLLILFGTSWMTSLLSMQIGAGGAAATTDIADNL